MGFSLASWFWAGSWGGWIDSGEQGIFGGSLPRVAVTADFATLAG